MLKVRLMHSVVPTLDREDPYPPTPITVSFSQSYFFNSIIHHPKSELSFIPNIEHLVNQFNIDLLRFYRYGFIYGLILKSYRKFIGLIIMSRFESHFNVNVGEIFNAHVERSLEEYVSGFSDMGVKISNEEDLYLTEVISEWFNRSFELGTENGFDIIIPEEISVNLKHDVSTLLEIESKYEEDELGTFLYEMTYNLADIIYSFALNAISIDPRSIPNAENSFLFSTSNGDIETITISKPLRMAYEITVMNEEERWAIMGL